MTNIFPNITFLLHILWELVYPAFPWSKYYWCTVSVGWMTALWMGWGPFCKMPNINQCRHWTVLFKCTAQSSVPSSHLSSHNLEVFFALTLITMIIITMIHTVTCHICHLWLKPVSVGQIQAGYAKKWMVESVSGVDQDNFLLGQHAVQAWTPFDSYGTSWGELFVPESPSSPCRISLRLW